MKPFPLLLLCSFLFLLLLLLPTPTLSDLPEEIKRSQEKEEQQQQRQKQKQPRLKKNKNTCAVITAIFGPAEKEGKPIAEQSLPCSFFLFTDDPSLPAHPTWQVITTPYHLQASLSAGGEEEGKGEKIFSQNQIGLGGAAFGTSSFLIAKFYKTQFHKIKILQDYETVIWLDGTIELTSANSTKVFVKLAKEYGMALFEHNRKSLWDEVHASNYGKYAGQRIVDQYARYLRRGYCEQWWLNRNNRVSPCPYSVDVGDVSRLHLISSPLSQPLVRIAQHQKGPSPDKRPMWDHNRSLTLSPNFGVWVTCYIGFDMRRPEVVEFLDLWWDETVYGSTQDQVSFAYLVWQTAFVPYTLPGRRLSGTANASPLHIKHAHNIGILGHLANVLGGKHKKGVVVWILAGLGGVVVGMWGGWWWWKKVKRVARE